MTNLSQSQQAAIELLRRKRARLNILDYANAIDIPGKPVGNDDETEIFKPVELTMAAHHRLTLSILDRISSTPHGRLMLFMPPGSAKSTYASVVFPSAYLGRESERRLILASYGDDLARKMGRRTRSIIKQQRYNHIYGHGLTAESAAAQEFALTNGSEYMACGIMSGITGNRAHGIIIDDPTKGREQAESKTIRDKTWDAYSDDLKTRLIPGGWICIIQTRWHEDDLSGRILPESWKGESGKILCRDGNEWEVICLQARCEVEGDPLGRKIGDYLWPEWFDRKHWAQFESSARTWSALYQQLPTPLDGEFFKPRNIQIIDAIPAGRITWVRGWDLASVEGGGDWTTGVKIGRMEDGRFVVADVARAQYSPDMRDALIKATASQDGRECKQDIPQDPGQAGKTQIVAMGKLLVGYPMVFGVESGDKIVRAEPFAAQVNTGNVLLLRGEWNSTYIEELRGFPNAKYDDQVDGSSRAFARLLTARRGFFSL